MKLYYFTLSYPFGLGEQWKANELKQLVHYFDSITVVPYSYAGNKTSPKKMPEGVLLEGPLFEEYAVDVSKKTLLKIIFSRHGYKVVREFFRKGVYKNKNHFISWVSVSVHVQKLLTNKILKRILSEGDANSVLYFYWGRGTSDILPFINTRKYRKTVVRMHRFDLFEYESDNYIPYRRDLLNNISMAAPSSEAGRKHLKALYPQCKSGVEVFRCGTVDNGRRNPSSPFTTLKIVSCSLLSPVKRVHLMIESLRYIDFPVQWTHIGDGVLRNEMDELIKKYGLDGRFIITGLMNSEDIQNYYSNNPFHLFVNVSESEGVPFSIMEAFAAGIPVLATNVGGTGEIVDALVGGVLPKDLTPEMLAAAINEFYKKSPDEQIKTRDAAYARYKERCDAVQLANELGKYLVS